jgi:hypothetical protein
LRVDERGARQGEGDMFALDPCLSVGLDSGVRGNRRGVTVNVSDAASPLVSVAVTLSDNASTTAGMVPLNIWFTASNTSQDGRG